jgi:agmatine deiminase
MGLPVVHAPFVAEGGAIVTDGEGNIVTTKSCLLNENRNPGFGRSLQERMKDIERGFSQLGGQKIIWLDGDTDEPVSSGHIDGYVLFTGPGTVLVEGFEPEDVSGEHCTADIGTLRVATDACGQKIDVKAVQPPHRKYLQKHFRKGIFGCSPSTILRRVAAVFVV